MNSYLKNENLKVKTFNTYKGLYEKEKIIYYYVNNNDLVLDKLYFLSYHLQPCIFDYNHSKEIFFKCRDSIETLYKLILSLDRYNMFIYPFLSELINKVNKILPTYMKADIRLYLKHKNLYTEKYSIN